MKIKEFINFINLDASIHLEYQELCNVYGVNKKIPKTIKFNLNKTPNNEQLKPFKNIEEIYNLSINEKDISYRINPYDFTNQTLVINSHYVHNNI